MEAGSTGGVEGRRASSWCSPGCLARRGISNPMLISIRLSDGARSFAMLISSRCECLRLCCVFAFYCVMDLLRIFLLNELLTIHL